MVATSTPLASPPVPPVLVPQPMETASEHAANPREQLQLIDPWLV